MRAAERGFTLLEMVVSLLVLALIAGTLALSFRLATGSMERGEGAARETARLRAGMGILVRAIRSADPTGIPMDNGASAPYFAGERDRIRFLSAVSASAVTDRGFRLLAFFNGKDAAGRGMALAESAPFRVDGAQGWEGDDASRVIIRGAEDVAFSFSEGPSKDGTWEWVDGWDAGRKGRLPAAVRVEFTTPSQGGPLKTSFVVPVPAGGGV